VRPVSRSSRISHTSRERAVQHVEPIVKTLRQPLMEILQHREYVKPYDIAISMWSLASLRMKKDDTMLAELSARLLTMLHRLNPTDMAHVMWACGSMQYQSPLLLEELVSAAERVTGEFKTCELSTFVWGMCKTNHRSREVLRAASQRVVSTAEDFATEELVRLLWAFTKCRFCDARDCGVHEVALKELIKPERLSAMLPQDYANLLWAMAGLKVAASPAVLDTFADAAAPALARFKSAEVANVVYGFGALMHRHDELLLAAADEVTRRGGMMSDQELCMIIWSFGKLGVVPDDGLLLKAAAAEFRQRMSVDELSPLTISNVIKAFAKLDYLPDSGFMDALSAAAVGGLAGFRMSELSNLLWAYQQLAWVDEDLFERSEEFIIENMHLCTRHHVSSMVMSFRRNGYMCDRLITVARNNDFHV
jgi:hypothetical protein